jgi:hypothetical protein
MFLNDKIGASDSVGRALRLYRGDHYSSGESLIYWIGWLNVAYIMALIIFNLTAYILYGHGVSPVPTERGSRNALTGSATGQHPLLRMGTSGIVGLDETTATNLTARVTKAVARPGRN